LIFTITLTITMSRPCHRMTIMYHRQSLLSEGTTDSDSESVHLIPEGVSPRVSLSSDLLSEIQRDLNESRRRFPVRFVFHHNIYSRHLYDVEGNVLRDNYGEAMNVFSKSMQDAFDSGHLRLLRNSTMTCDCYRYFITSNNQLERFIEERDYKSSRGPDIEYHIYPDNS